jgi:hypothetical protein
MWITRWISVAEEKLNAYNGDREFNSRKPWRFDEYGNIVGTGIKATHDQDLFAKYGNNRLWWVWAHTLQVPDPATFGMKWPDPNWNKAGVPDLKTFVEDGLAGRIK